MSTQVATATVRPALESVMDACVENRHQETLVWDPSPERDSLVEDIAALLRTGADAGLVADVAARVRQIMESNARERGYEHRAAGVLDHAIAGMHVAGLRSALTVKDATRRLRPHLRLLDKARKQGVDGIAYFQACRAIDDVLDELSPAVLRGNGLRHELGRGPHDLLLELAGDQARGAVA